MKVRRDRVQYVDRDIGRLILDLPDVVSRNVRELTELLLSEVGGGSGLFHVNRKVPAQRMGGRRCGHLITHRRHYGFHTSHTNFRRLSENYHTKQCHRSIIVSCGELAA